MKEKLKSLWYSFYEEPHDEKIDVFNIAKTPFIPILENSGITIMTVNNATGRIDYLSDNIEQYGIEKDEYVKEGIRYQYNLIIPFQKNCPEIYSALLEKAFKTWYVDDLKNLKSIAVGLRLTHELRGSIAIMNKTQFADEDKNGLPLRSISFIEDVSHLMKDDNYWLMVWNEKNPKNSLVYHSNPNLILTGKLLSKREKQIMKLISAGSDDDEIAQLLNIKHRHILRHRRILLDKFNVKNMTAFIIIAKLIGLSFEDE